MIKALFFDIDGTLVSFNTHEIPQSTVDALEQAKRNGVGVYISTGRPVKLINNLHAIEHLIDGYITTNGAYSFIGDKVVSCVDIPLEDARTLIRLADEMNFATMVVGAKDLTVYHPDEMVDKVFRQLLNVNDLGEDISLDTVLSQPILQLTPIIDEQQEKLVMPQLPHCIAARWYPAFADVTARGADKGKALQRMVEHLGMDISETMAFGDGGNDKSIISAAGIGVAMGNAIDDVKALASYVTDHVDNDGVSKALRHFGII